ncbi:MAG: hypothetical protein FIA99_08200 [Ruminiclostridium sp.]|nr:hypothetical protein [Ruminiclostridium sp.]
MNRINLICITFLLITITLTACQNNTSSVNIEKSTSLKLSTNKGNDVIKQSDNRNLTNAFFLRKWKISRVLSNAGISALTDEEANKYIGKEIHYTETIAEFENESIKNPYYYLTEMTSDEFFDYYGYVSFEKLGFHKDKMQHVEIFTGNTNDYANLWINLAGSFLIIDENTLLVCWEGYFFEVSRSE